MLDAQTFQRTQASPSQVCITVQGFQMPAFLSHAEGCTCYACQTPYCAVLACQIAGLEASVYFRAKELDIARHFFAGALRMFRLVDLKLGQIAKGYEKLGFEDYVTEIALHFYRKEFLIVQVEILIEASLMELSEQNYRSADEHIVRIHELIQEGPDLDGYLRHEIMNLMCSSAYKRKIMKSPVSDETGLESELEALRLSPGASKKSEELQKTPECKGDKRPKTAATRIVVSDEEVPILKRRVIKLNLDDAEEATSTAQEARKTRFKVPVPVTSEPVTETFTPIPTPRRNPKILLTLPSLDRPSAEELATPLPRSPKQTVPGTRLDTSIKEHVFFTAKTSMTKTYTKKSVMKDVVKNLEKEFAAPKADEGNNTAGGSRTHRARKKEPGTLRSLQRSTSPGNLDNNPTYKISEQQKQKRKLKENLSAEEKTKK